MRTHSRFSTEMKARVDLFMPPLLPSHLCLPFFLVVSYFLACYQAATPILHKWIRAARIAFLSRRAPRTTTAAPIAVGGVHPAAEVSGPTAVPPEEAQIPAQATAEAAARRAAAARARVGAASFVAGSVLWLAVAPLLAAALFETALLVTPEAWTERGPIAALPCLEQPMRGMVLGAFLLQTWAYICQMEAPRWLAAALRAGGVLQQRGDAAAAPAQAGAAQAGDGALDVAGLRERAAVAPARSWKERSEVRGALGLPPGNSPLSRSKRCGIIVGRGCGRC